MKSSLTVVPGADFAVPVIPAGPLQPPGITKRELVDQYMHTLSDLFFERDLLTEKEHREVMQLVGQRHALNQRATELIERVRGRAREKITVELESAKAAVRAQQEKIAKHKHEIAAETRELNRLNDAKTRAISARDAAQEAKRSLSRYADRSTHEAANSPLVKREAEAEAASQAAGASQQRINYMNLVDLKPLIEKLNELVNEEARLNHYVSGQGYTNELGIVVPSRPPL
jgi:regulator of sigma D